MRLRGFSAIGLVRPKTPANVGCVLRAAGCFGASFVGVTPLRPRYHGSPLDTQKAYRHMPLIHSDSIHDLVPHDCVPVAVEITPRARCLTGYTHPERAFYIFGPEDAGVPPDVMAWCRDVVSIPTRRCLNLAATVNVVLYDRMMKGGASAQPERDSYAATTERGTAHDDAQPKDGK